MIDDIEDTHIPNNEYLIVVSLDDFILLCEIRERALDVVEWYETDIRSMNYNGPIEHLKDSIVKLKTIDRIGL